MEIVAEFTYNHLGNIKLAIKMIDAAIKAGATSVKFEMRNASYYYQKKNSVPKTRLKYELNDSQIKQFADHCKNRGIGWFASVHDLVSLKRLLRFQPKYIKIASREACNRPFLKAVKKQNRRKIPMVISTGGLSISQIRSAAQLFLDQDLTLLHTVSIYPTPAEDLNMNRILFLKEEFECKVGYSGHEEGYLPSLYATFIGVDYLERHFSLTNKKNKIAVGKTEFKDSQCTLSEKKFAEMTNAIQLIQRMNTQVFNKKVNQKEIERLNAYGKIKWDGKDIYVE